MFIKGEKKKTLESCIEANKVKSLQLFIKGPYYFPYKFSSFETNFNFVTLSMCPMKLLTYICQNFLCKHISGFAGKESNKSRTVIIVVPIISFVVLIIISYIYLRLKKPREKPESK